LPVRTGASLPPGWGEEGTRDFAPRAIGSSGDFRQLLDWPDELRATVPRAFDVVGDIVLVRLPPELEARRAEVGEALLRFVPGSRLVGLDRGVQGTERLRRVERIAGGGPWTTRHRENRLEFDVDVERAYFSPRLAGEHARFAASVRDGERVYDLCCGVGPFSVTIAREGRAVSVVAVDSNPQAIELLRRTLRRYSFGTRVSPVDSSVEAFARLAPPVERVVMNLPREGIKYGPLVAPLVRPGGSLQFYEVVPRDEVGGRESVVERALSPVGPFTVREIRVVHPYSPGRDLLAVEVLRAAG
jgi:tRNA (guanine37-N1)-methyltransferase